MREEIRDSRIAYVTVEHSYYGCETGCCGWIAYAYDELCVLLHQSSFNFFDGDQIKDAREFAEKCFPGSKFNEEESDWKCTEY
jgi:hypothetical protein